MAAGASGTPIVEVLYSFPAPPANPMGELVQMADGSFLGTTSTGGASGDGTIFRRGTDGTLQTLVEFTGKDGSARGALPAGALVLAGDGNYYGTTAKGGAGDFGTIFSLTPGGVFTTVVEFTGATGFSAGAAPYGGFLLGQDGNLYGTTARGGNGDFGTIFSLAPDGTFYTTVEFTGNGAFNKGANPYSALVQTADGVLYGTTAKGGATDGGTVFSVTTDGTLKTLVQFTNNGAINRGSAPYGALTAGAKGRLYGTTARGGGGDFGTVFTMTTGGKLTTLLEFTGTVPGLPGAQPEAKLMLAADGNFYGSTLAGGAANAGTLFRLTPAGRLTTLVNFSGDGATHKGSAPAAALVAGQDGALYGSTFRGGASNAGTLFSMTTGGVLATLADFPGVNPATWSLPGVVLGANGEFYGTTTGGGIRGKGTVFRISKAGVQTTLAEFTGTAGSTKGEAPLAPLVQADDGNYYGTTSKGGAGNLGTLFRITPDGVLTTIAEFTGATGTVRGSAPAAALVQKTGGALYGTTSAGGATDHGTIFRIGIHGANGAFTTLADFSGMTGVTRGSGPGAAMVAGTGGELYGTTRNGGVHDLGTLFRLAANDTSFQTLVEFADDPAGVKGAYPQAPLVFGNDGKLYGSTASGGATGDGTLFRAGADGALTTLLEFTGRRSTLKGTYPQAALFPASDLNLYGTTTFGGTLNEGTAFQLSPSGALKTLWESRYSGASPEAAYPASALIAGTDGNLYATTSGGGGYGAGAVLRIRLRTATTKEEAGSVQSDGARLWAKLRGGLLQATVAFQFGPNTNYGSSTDAQSIPAGAGDVVIYADVTGLQPNTTYHYRTVTIDSSGTVYGPDQVFTTEPYAMQVLATGDPVAGEAPGTQVSNFGVPAIADNGEVTVLATLAQGAVRTPAILAGNPLRVLARKGDAPPKGGSATAPWVSFSDPACDGTGHVLFGGSMLDGATARFGLWTNAAGALAPAALTGASAFGISGAKWTAITSWAISPSGSTFFTATFGGSSSGAGVWSFDAAGNHLLLKQGDVINGQSATGFTVLAPVPGSPGQGRSYRDGTITARVSLGDGTQAMVTLAPDAAPVAVLSTPYFLPGHPPRPLVQSFGYPSAGGAGTYAFLGILQKSRPAIVANSPTDDFRVITKYGFGAPPDNTDSFLTFRDPVYNAQSMTAFAATVAGPGVTAQNAAGIWWNTPGGLDRVARAGDEPPGVPGATWSTFNSLALPDNGGLVFVAGLSPGANGSAAPAGVNATNNLGVWGIDGTGSLRLLLRTGDSLPFDSGRKPLALFTMLSPVLGSPGQGRSYNSSHDLVFRAVFTDHTQSVMKIHLP